MLETVAGLLRFASSLLFGVAVTALFAGIAPEKKNRIVVGFACAALLTVQFFFLWTWGLEVTSKIYPLIVHAPMVLLLSL